MVAPVVEYLLCPTALLPTNRFITEVFVKLSLTNPGCLSAINFVPSKVTIPAAS